MSFQDCRRYQIGEAGGLIATLFELVQSIEANLLVRRIFFVPLGDASVEIPAVVIEARLARQFLHFGIRFALEVLKAYDYIRHLYSGVVDVILYIHWMRRFTQQTHKGVAENGVA